jgi:threonylcarbamoyladenosine tRNA methylthiotransferase MtaB
MEQTIKFFTLGCKVNQYETQLIREDFLRRGFRELNNGAVAGCCVVNTCTVTQRADAESLNLLRRAQRENPRAKIIVTGCLAELDARKIRQAAPAARIIPKARLMGSSRGISFFQGRTRAFIKAQDGCNNFCSYCRVPLARGPSRSRPMGRVLAEAKRLAKAGYREIVLTGICLGSYGRDLKPQADIAELAEKIGQVAGIARLRLSSIELLDVRPRLIGLLRRSQKLCPHLHIPLQSGDDEVLKKMNRRYTAEEFIRRVKEIKRLVPDFALTTDALVGFPGEGEANFRNTIAAIKRLTPLKTHVFPYSPRPGTAAEKIAGQAAPQVIRERCARLRKAADKASAKFLRRFNGRRLKVLTEGECPGKPGFMQGYSNNYIKVIFRGDSSSQGGILGRIFCLTRARQGGYNTRQR